MKITHLRQPRRSYVCGQACVAMVLGLPDVDSACRVIGHSRRTRTKDIVLALGPAALSSRLSPARRDGSNLPDFCLLRSRWGVTPGAHLSLYKGGQVFEPLLYGPVSLGGWLVWLSGDDGRLTSFLPLVEVPELMTGTS